MDVEAIVNLKDLCCFSVEVRSEVKAVFKLGDKQCDDAIHKADPEATLPAEESSTPFPTTARHFVRPFSASATSVCRKLVYFVYSGYVCFCLRCLENSLYVHPLA